MDEDTSINLIDLKYVAELATRGLQPICIPGHQPFVFEPNGVHEYVPLREDQIPLPDHIRQKVTIDTLESFISYVKQFRTHTAQIFAAVRGVGAEFDAILDYHEAGADGKPGRSKHEVNYRPLYTAEFKGWLGIDGKPLTQDEFLDHLRRWGDVITSHTDADMIELASSLEFTTSGQMSSKVERTTGGRQLTVNELVNGTASQQGRKVTVPDAMKITLQVFNDGKAYEIAVDILYRPQGGVLKIIVELRRTHRVIQTAIADMIADVEVGTEIEVFQGSV